MRRPGEPLALFLIVETPVKQLAVYGLFGLVALALTGCGSVPTQHGQTVTMGDLSDLPQTLLTGAKLEHARSVAMGTARSKGWTIKEAAANQLVLQRSLPADSPQAAALAAGNLQTPPQIEVQTNLVERGDGTTVALRAFMVANPGTSDEKRVDYTSDFENELLISLSSLQSAWIQSRAKVTSVVPLPSDQDVAEQSVSRDGGTAEDTALPAVAVETAERATAPAAPTAAITSAPTPSSAPSPRLAPVVSATPSTSSATASSPAVAPQVAQATSSANADFSGPARLPPASDAGVAATATPAAPAAIVEATPRNDMLVLNESARKGLWSYYAEDYARLRGCAIGDRGAMLLQENPTFELHEVECVGSANLLVKCQGGVCEPMR
jgi:hypothetical protein